eukprot:8042119-Pyramimonas_sp.AAC.1
MVSDDVVVVNWVFIVEHGIVPIPGTNVRFWRRAPINTASTSINSASRAQSRNPPRHERDVTNRHAQPSNETSKYDTE